MFLLFGTALEKKNVDFFFPPLDTVRDGSFARKRRIKEG